MGGVGRSGVWLGRSGLVGDDSMRLYDIYVWW